MDKTFEMPAEDRELARRLASGESTLRSEAESVYQRHVRQWVKAGRQDVAMAFLSEVFSPCPDLLLRSRYRKQLIAS